METPLLWLLTILLAAVPWADADTPPVEDDAEASAPKAPHRDFQRQGEAVSAGHWRSVLGEGPVRLVGSVRSGPFKVWRTERGAVIRVEHTQGGALAEVRRFDPAEQAHSTARFDAGRPVEVIIHGAREQRVDVSEWRSTGLEGAPGLSLVLPEALVEGALKLSPGRLTAAVDEPADVWGAAFGEQLASAAGGVLLARATTWIDAEPVARYTLALPHGSTPLVAEVWALPAPKATIILTFTAPQGAAPGSLDTLAPGRAVIALARWTRP